TPTNINFTTTIKSPLFRSSGLVSGINGTIWQRHCRHLILYMPSHNSQSISKFSWMPLAVSLNQLPSNNL
ncbi:hypothetical protein, partial [Levilactobacillus spicheri]|uniref:hypothetical protein n=1 Tax=Levilactobacillus spicheri TaxID=216463 RepID=UPI001CDC5C0F